MTDQGSMPGQVVALPSLGELFTDARGTDRWLRVTWHDEADLVVLSLWRNAACVGTLRLARDEVPALVDALVRGLAGRPLDVGRTHDEAPADVDRGLTHEGGARGGS